MIVVIVDDDENGIPVVSHGIDLPTLEAVVLPQVDVRYIAKWNVELQWWVLNE